MLDSSLHAGCDANVEECGLIKLTLMTLTLTSGR
jgi:hypothetical protein